MNNIFDQVDNRIAAGQQPARLYSGRLNRGTGLFTSHLVMATKWFMPSSSLNLLEVDQVQLLRFETLLRRVCELLALGQVKASSS